jgi:hypothetical protein
MADYAFGKICGVVFSQHLAQIYDVSDTENLIQRSSSSAVLQNEHLVIYIQELGRWQVG